jgi:hypothetical protein
MAIVAFKSTAAGNSSHSLPLKTVPSESNHGINHQFLRRVQQDKKDRLPISYGPQDYNVRSQVQEQHQAKHSPELSTRTKPPMSTHRVPKYCERINRETNPPNDKIIARCNEYDRNQNHYGDYNIHGKIEYSPSNPSYGRH